MFDVSVTEAQKTLVIIQGKVLTSRRTPHPPTNNKQGAKLREGSEQF